jgi:hypothetical protein
MKKNAANLLSQLLKLDSFKLEKISSKTHPPDILNRHRGIPLSRRRKIAEWIKAGRCYRIRLHGRGYVYGCSISDTIQAALQDQFSCRGCVAGGQHVGVQGGN